MDITELKAREQGLQAQAEEKRQLDANEAAGAELGGEQRELAEHIHRCANELLTVINDTLDFSQVESGRPDIEEVRFSLPVTVQEVSKILGFVAERKGLAFHTAIAADIESDFAVMGDPGRVRQVMTNLLANSTKFTNQGSVTLSVTKENEAVDAAEIKFAIQDTGIGVDEEVQKRLFQPSHQGDASTERRLDGRGLGLSVSKTLLELMKGRIELRSRAGQGTTVTFWISFKKARPRPTTGPSSPAGLYHPEPILVCYNSEVAPTSDTAPVKPADAVDHSSRSAWGSSSSSLLTVADPEEQLPRSERANIHVLVVDDNPVNRKYAVRVIEKLGFQVAAVCNGKEALDYIAAAKEGTLRKPDIILMDVHMPIIDGYECTQYLRHNLDYKTYVSQVPVVALTASATQDDREKCERAGMDDYLPRPVTVRSLERMLVRWSIQGRPPPANDEPPSFPSRAQSASVVLKPHL
ncbi:uncharacterized protein THITE_2113885 [Thermothielavioides terrestris NRRL 8126]|uniref:Histidine kinase n=1 Tax=Thermothielavioides terrestris (strain ATCC 38088 / NRRL 8126) TaxID=578455 RepID=G2R4N4_THETT|nr:uncharacterized protein THITE_2113885 [Thermothielavioides terrestris NRRL 8126]AEO66074.1 hypothetical protein THITE_2113885 [Thermothielavioides terrestris NRRL 8126]